MRGAAAAAAAAAAVVVAVAGSSTIGRLISHQQVAVGSSIDSLIGRAERFRR